MKLIRWLLVAMAMSACTSDGVGPAPAAPVNWRSFDAVVAAPARARGPSAKERHVAEKYVASLASPTFDGLDALLDDTVHLAIAGRNDVRGKDAVVRAHAATFGALDARTVVPLRVLRTDKTQIVELWMTGTHARECLGVAPTGRPVGMYAVSILSTLDDGTLSEVRTYFDVAVTRAQLGVGPKALLELPAPNAPPSAPPAVLDDAASDEEAANVKTVRKSLDALEGHEGGEEAAYAAAFTDDAEVRALDRRRPLRGRADLVSYFRASRRSIGQLDTTIVGIWGIGSHVVVEYRVTGEQLGAIEWIPFVRDRAVRFEIVDVIEMRGGKMSAVHRYEDRNELDDAPPR